MNVNFKNITMIAVMMSGISSLSAFAQISEVSPVLSPVLSPVQIAKKILIAEIEKQRNALFDDPENAQLHIAIAAKYMEQGSADIAENELMRAMALGTPLQEIMVELGNIYIKRAKYEQIIENFSIEGALREDQGEIYLFLGRAHYEMGNMELAFENLLAARELIDERFDLVAPLAQIYNLYGDYEEAEINADDALEFNAIDVDMLMLKGELRHRKFGSKHSFRYFESAAFYQPNNITAQVKVASALYNLKLDDRAFKYIDKALRLDKSHALANFMAAVISARSNKKTTALAYLNNAGQGLDQFVPGLLLKAKLYYDAKSFKRATECLNQIILIDKNHIEARRLLASSLLFQNKPAAAVNVLKYIIDYNMVEDIDYMLLASAYLQNENYDKASQYFKDISGRHMDRISERQKRSLDGFEDGKEFGVKLDIDNIYNKNIALNQQQVLRIYTALNERKYNLAFEMAVRIVKANRRNPVGYNLLGLSYQGQKKFDEALSNFRRAISLDPSFHDARINLARLEYEIGQKNKAIATLNDILRIDESYLAAYEALFEIALAGGDEINAEKHLITAKNINVNSIAIRQKLMDFYLAINDTAKAAMIAHAMMNDFPDHYLSFKSMARVNLKDGDFSLSVYNLEQALSQKKNDDEIYFLLSDAYIGDNKTALVRPMLNEGLLYVKDTIPLIKKLIYLAERDGNFNDSYRYVDQLKLTESTRPAAFFYQGDLNLLENRPTEAIKSYQSAYKSGGNENKAKINIANARELLNNLQ